MATYDEELVRLREMLSNATSISDLGVSRTIEKIQTSGLEYCLATYVTNCLFNVKSLSPNKNWSPSDHKFFNSCSVELGKEKLRLNYQETISSLHYAVSLGVPNSLTVLAINAAILFMNDKNKERGVIFAVEASIKSCIACRNYARLVFGIFGLGPSSTIQQRIYQASANYYRKKKDIKNISEGKNEKIFSITLNKYSEKSFTELKHLLHETCVDISTTNNRSTGIQIFILGKLAKVVAEKGLAKTASSMISDHLFENLQISKNQVWHPEIDHNVKKQLTKIFPKFSNEIDYDTTVGIIANSFYHEGGLTQPKVALVSILIAGFSDAGYFLDPSLFSKEELVKLTSELFITSLLLGAPQNKDKKESMVALKQHPEIAPSRSPNEEEYISGGSSNSEEEEEWEEEEEEEEEEEVDFSLNDKMEQHRLEHQSTNTSLDNPPKPHPSVNQSKPSHPTPVQRHHHASHQASSPSTDTIPNILAGVAILAFAGYALAFIAAGWLGLAEYWHWFWAIVATVLTVVFRFPLLTMIGAFMCAKNMWDWHWFFVVCFVFPGAIMIFLKAILVSLVGLATVANNR